MKKICTLILLTAMLVVAERGMVKGQRVYANSVSYSSPNFTSKIGCGGLGLGPCDVPTVNNPLEVLNTTANKTTYTRVNSSAGLAIGLGAYQGEIELKFPDTLTKGTTSYIRINNANPDLLNSLLGGNLGKLLANVVGLLALGDKYFEVGARMGSGNIVTSGSSSDAFSSTPNIKLVKDANGFFYIAITPNKTYDRVYIKDFTNAVLSVGSSNYTDVYYAFTGNNPCGQAFATSFEGTGISLDILKLGKAGVKNMEYAIDADQTNYSEISIGALGVVGTISQDIYFETPSTIGDEFAITLQNDASVLNLGVANNIIISAYLGTSQVFFKNLSTVINLDLLGLNSGQKLIVNFNPNVKFDRVQITLSSLLSVNLTQKIRIYAVSRTTGQPDFSDPTTSNSISICAGNTASLKATTASDNNLVWYDVAVGGIKLAEVASGDPFVTPVLNTNKIYYVSSRKAGCSESARVPVTITVNPLPTITLGTLPSACQEAQTTTIPYTSNTGTPITYNIIWDTNALAKGFTNVSAATFPTTSPITITKPTSLNVIPGLYSGTITVTNANGCTSRPNSFSLRIHPKPTAPLITSQ